MLQLGHHEHGAPPERLFASQDIAVDVIPDVQHLAPRGDPEHRVEVFEGTALVRLDALVFAFPIPPKELRSASAVAAAADNADGEHGRAVVRVAKIGRLRVNLEDGGAFVLEKRGLTRAGDDGVEELGPVRGFVLAHGAVHQVVHHHVGEVPERVGE